jgi:preprotein translocase subunit YajC
VDRIAGLLPFIVLLIAFYFLLLRPNRARQQKMAQMQAELAPGARIMTTAGLQATVVAVEDDLVVLEVAPGVQTRWARAAVARVLTEPAGGASLPGLENPEDRPQD